MAEEAYVEIPLQSGEAGDVCEIRVHDLACCWDDVCVIMQGFVGNSCFEE